MPFHCQRVIRADVPTVNRFDGTGSSKKVTQDHKIVRKFDKRADDQHEVSTIFTMRLDNLCERGARILQMIFRFQIELLNLLRSSIRVMARAPNKSFTVAKVFGNVEMSSR